jgi:hypothetical protein
MGTRLRGHQYAKESKAKLVDQQPIARTSMQKPPLDPDVADTAPSDPVLTVYDEEHLMTYLRLLDAEVDGADWRDVARIVLHINPEHESDRARRAFESHLSRAKWITELVTGTCYAVARRLKTTLPTAVSADLDWFYYSGARCLISR